MKLYTSSDKSRFYTSGLLAFSIYIFVFMLFLIYIGESNPKKFDSFKKTTVLELDIILSDEKAPEKPKPKIKVEKKKVEEKVVKKAKSKSAEKKSNLKSLFANVKTKTIQKKPAPKEVVNNVVASSVSSRYKSKFEKSRKTEDLNVSSALSDIKTQKRKPILTTSAKYENDPYYSKIHELLAKRWNPMSIVDGLEAKVLVIIYSDGEFDYKFLRYSNDERFDSLLKAFLTEQKNVKYPPHNKGYKTDIEVTFKSKG